MDNKKYFIPSPIVNKKEEESLSNLAKRYEKLISPSALTKVSNKIVDITPNKVKTVLSEVKDGITEAELYSKCMEEVAKGFEVIEKTAAKLSISEQTIVSKVNETTKRNEITSINEICLAREYEIAKLVSSYKTKDLALALTEGAATGAAGFAGLPFNIVLSTFLFYRAVQSVAMYYGYDTKNNPDELVIAGEVFMNAINPASKGVNEANSLICKVMALTETTVVRQTAKKTWADMANQGGLCLLITQIRALANKAAKKALEKAGQKELEKTVFTGVLEQLGKNFSKKAVGRAMPVFGAIIGGLFDTSQMNKILEYADIFYRKRFIAEKEVRIYQLVNAEKDEIIDVDVDEIHEIDED